MWFLIFNKIKKVLKIIYFCRIHSYSLFRIYFIAGKTSSEKKKSKNH